MIFLADFAPLSVAKVINNRGFGKVHAILIEEVPVQTTLRDGASFRRLTSLKGLKYLHQPSNFVPDILTNYLVCLSVKS